MLTPLTEVTFQTTHMQFVVANHWAQIVHQIIFYSSFHKRESVTCSTLSFDVINLK